ncbi:MAG: class I SAM-dependent methyltransferase [Proteobacteria bacterium]|nr:class I SAM-dependent methyltransferase [Pseudomonadota bacterium]
MAVSRLSEDDERRAAWSRLWAQGGAGSFHDPADGDLPLRAHWQTWFATLPAHAHVLDIATGNGILPRWLVTAHPTATCDAIDLAAIQPGWQDERVHFHAGMAAERLPWIDPRFDAIVSQFGAEYGDLDSIFDQIARIARPNAQLRFVSHHTESLPIQLAIEEISHIDWLMQKGGWLDASIDMLMPVSLLRDPQSQQRLHSDATLQLVRRIYDNMTHDLANRIKMSRCPDILIDAHNQTTKIFDETSYHGHKHGYQLSCELMQWLIDSRSRLNDMQRCALERRDLDLIIRKLRRLGCSTSEFDFCQERGHLMGWQIFATYPA